MVLNKCLKRLGKLNPLTLLLWQQFVHILVNKMIQLRHQLPLLFVFLLMAPFVSGIFWSSLFRILTMV